MRKEADREDKRERIESIGIIRAIGVIGKIGTRRIGWIGESLLPLYSP